MNCIPEVNDKRTNNLLLLVFCFLLFAPSLVDAQLSGQSSDQHSSYHTLRASNMAGNELNRSNIRHSNTRNKAYNPNLQQPDLSLQRPLYTTGTKVIPLPESVASIVKFPYSAYSYHDLGIFCKWEVNMEKAAKIPVKFRLGEVQYVERLEGKLPVLPQ